MKREKLEKKQTQTYKPCIPFSAPSPQDRFPKIGSHACLFRGGGKREKKEGAGKGGVACLVKLLSPTTVESHVMDRGSKGGVKRKKKKEGRKDMISDSCSRAM